MTGNRRAAPEALGTPSIQTHFPNATTTPGQTQSAGHSPNKFMSELHSIRSESNADLNVYQVKAALICLYTKQHCCGLFKISQ